MSACAKRSEEHTSELQSLTNIVCRLLLEKEQVENRSYSIEPGRALHTRCLELSSRLRQPWAVSRSRTGTGWESEGRPLPLSIFLVNGPPPRTPPFPTRRLSQ